MLRSSLDAIRRLLNQTVGEVTTIYVNRVPDGFEQPSLFVQLAPIEAEDLTVAITLQRVTWQIVYFPKLTRAMDPDAFDQIDVAERILNALQASAAIKAPDGQVYHITQIDGGPRDSEVYIAVTLEGQSVRISDDDYELMQMVHLDQEGG